MPANVPLPATSRFFPLVSPSLTSLEALPESPLIVVELVMSLMSKTLLALLRVKLDWAIEPPVFSASVPALTIVAPV